MLLKKCAIFRHASTPTPLYEYERSRKTSLCVSADPAFRARMLLKTCAIFRHASAPTLLFEHECC
ncbi:hypothetical protein chmu116 [Choristoneura murinana nucleopolyhedrovirus]|uniref:Uncharacterized protein n=1 Tax=Choristoneura murinana nucleopolyhedrovirus TaxID=1987479 RepID=V9XPZ9_9ABAC|nr:hypothetical protein chmu116 [Choristoneura murinana nucleopolyhedrovirus]AHD25602.1 hypothetical protein chmu116 [Choristoneura murinana nucleopolyhedrovirus]